VTAAASSGLPVTLAIEPSSAGVCSISGSSVSLTGAGTCAIDANQAGSGEYEPAPQAQQSFAVAAAAAATAVVPQLPGAIGRETPPSQTPPPDSAFTTGASFFDAASGRVTFIESVSNSGTFRWLLTFPNGKFGVLASSKKCKAGFVRLGSKCRPSRIVFSKGSAAVAAGVVIFKLQPSASALKALRKALKQKKGLPVTATFTFQSAGGGSPVSHTRSLTVKLKKK
jgi:hypothetical protein